MLYPNIFGFSCISGVRQPLSVEKTACTRFRKRKIFMQAVLF